MLKKGCDGHPRPWTQDVHLAGELGVGVDGAGLTQNLATLDVGLGNTAEQSAHVIASLSVIQSLTEHLQAGDDGGLLLLVGQANDLHGLAGLDQATLHGRWPRCHGQRW